MTRTALCILLALGIVITVGPAAYERTPDLRAVADALAIGQARDEGVRQRFHRPYLIRVGRPPIDYVDVVTPFRRVELAAEERAQTGGLFRQQEALAVLREHGDTLKLFLEAIFHPQNTFVGVPPYTVTLAAVDMPLTIEPREQQRIPRFTPRISSGRTPLPYPLPPSLPAGGEPVIGGTVIVTFDSQRLDPAASYDVVIQEAGKELAKVRLDLSKFR
jgi:hypothetical protein